MLLSDIFSNIATLDAASIYVGGSDDGTVDEANYPKVINAINLALTALYTEFNLKYNSVVVDLYSHITEYKLHSNYARSNSTSTETYKYVSDTTYVPFEDDIITILDVVNEEGTPLPLNDKEDCMSLYTMRYNTIQHPYPEDGNTIFISYKANHPTIPVDVAPDEYEVELPTVLLDALLAYVAYKLYGPVNLQESTLQLNKFNQIVQQIKISSALPDDVIQNTLLEERGWV